MTKQAIISFLFFVVAAGFTDAMGQNCISNTSLDYNPPPVDGQFSPGQTVEICGSFVFDGGSVWPHGIIPIIPEGWDLNSLVVDPPNSCSGTGTWGWYESVTGTVSTAGTYGPGIFYDTGDGNPGSNYGDNCSGSFSFCFTLTTLPANDPGGDDCGSLNLDGADLTIDVMVIGDNLSGSWWSEYCGESYNFGSPVTFDCCSGEEISLEVCSSDPDVVLFDEFADTPTGGTWEGPGGSAFNGTFNPGTSADGVYTYTFDDGDCAAESTVEVTTTPAPDAGNGQNISTCISGDPIDLNDQIVGGDAGGTWTDPSNNTVTATFTPGTSDPGIYTYTVGDGTICPQSQTVVNVTVEPNPFAGDDGALTVCETEAELDLFNFLMNNPEAGGLWTDPQGNDFDGQFSPGSDDEGDYIYTVGDAPCSSSATVSVTIVSLPNAGDDATLTICESGNETDLFTLIGNAEAGGFWADPNNAGFDGLFTPGTDPEGDYVYQVGGAGCNDVATVSVSTLPAPEGTISADATYCEGSEIALTFELVGSGPFDVEYEINNITNSLTGISDGHTEMVTATGDATIELTLITDYSPEGCTAAGNSIDVEMIPTPSASISGGGGICETEEAIITFELTGTGPFDVVYSDGTDQFELNGINDGHTEAHLLSGNTTFTLISVSDNSASACDGNVGGSAAFAVNEAPSGSISGSADVCLGESTDITFNFVGDGPFDVVYTDGADNYSLNGIDDGHTVSVSPQFLSFYELESVISQGNPGCPGTTSGNVQITVSVPPTYNNLSVSCNDVNEDYVVTFTINGGNPNSYEVGGDSGTLNGNVFTSDEIPTGDTYTFLLDDGNGCGPVEISGDHTCDCITSAGTMQEDSIEVCSSETAIAIHNGNEVLDPNDALIFVIHDMSGNELGEIYAENDTPNFDYIPEIDQNTTYYISAVAGNSVGNSVDYSDPCLSVSPGTPITFFSLPYAEIISEPTGFCPGDSAEVVVTLLGNIPIEVEYAIDGVATGSITTESLVSSFMIGEPGTVTISAVTDENCPGTTIGSVEIEAFETPTATIEDTDICEGSDAGPAINLMGTGPWIVTYTIDGANPETININNSPYSLESGVSGNYEFTTITDANCTGTGSGPFEVSILELPSASVSGGGQICTGETGEIVFAGSGNGDVIIDYAIDGVPEGSIDLIDGEGLLETDEAGIYTITNVSDESCSNNGDGSSTELIVNPIPTADLSLTPSTLCEGDSALLSIAMTGNGPFNLVYSNGDEFIIEENSENINTYIFPENGQEINLISVEDSSDPTCSQDLDEMLVAEVLAVPDVPDLEDVFRCNNDTFPHIGVESLPNHSYSWTPQTGLSNPAISNPILQLENNTTEELTATYSLTVTNGICPVSTDMEITINPGPQVDFSYSPNPVTTEASTVNFYNQTPGNNSYEWLVDSMSISTNTNVIYEFPSGVEGYYLVELIAEDPETDCVNTHSEMVAVEGELQVYVPNAFTPDGDGINDLFAPVVNNYRTGTFEFLIFNRQGELVFQSQSPDVKWNGSDPSQEHYVQDAVYVWKLKVGDLYSSATREFSGSVTVLR